MKYEMRIVARPAYDNEKIVITDEMDETGKFPEGVQGWDGTDWNRHFFAGLLPGDWVIEITDKHGILNWQETGLFHVHMSEEGDGGFCKKVK